MIAQTLLSGRVALVTGAARGIGAVIATRLADTGADVAVTARDLTTLQRTVASVGTAGQRALPLPMDLRDGGSIDAVADQVVKHFGRVDIVVNNGGIGGPSGPVWELDDDPWQETLNVNVTGAFRLCRAVLPTMIEAGKGSIVLIGSLSAKRPLLHRTAYAASKMALIGFSRTLALEVATYGVRVNVVSPGFVQGERLDWVLEKQAEASGTSPELARENLRLQAPMERFVTADDVADAVIFLASDGSRSITGCDLGVNAGLVME